MTESIPRSSRRRRGSPFRTERRSKDVELVFDPDGLRLYKAKEEAPTGILLALKTLVLEILYSTISFLRGLPTAAGRLRGQGTRTAVVLGVMAALLLASFGLAELPGRKRSQPTSALLSVLGSSGPENELGTIIDGTQVRARFAKEIVSLSVADEDLVKADIANTREVLLTGLESGATSLTVGFDDDETEIYQLSVQPDFAVLRRALNEIDPEIRMDVAPDREAVVLSGTVDLIATSLAAERTVRAYLNAGENASKTETTNYYDNGVLASFSVTSSGGGVLNSIRTRETFEGIETRIQDALREVGADDIRVRRVQHGVEAQDANDILVLEGTVPDQITLTRALSLASRMFLGTEVEENDIRVIGDESGALMRGNQNNSTQQLSGNNAASLVSGTNNGGGGGGNRLPQLNNQLSANLARATSLSLADGRVLSFVEVEDLPQVRVDIRFLEINRRALLDYDSEFAAAWSENAPTLGGNSTLPSTSGGVTGAGDVQEVFGFLGGALNNQFQLSGNDWAIDTAITLLENEGIAKSLASPSLTVLSGEQAFFQVGGVVPFEQNLATGAGDVVLNGTGFVDFGVNLAVRPLIGNQGAVTIDVQPEISLPDSELTDQIRDSTGGALSTSAFSTRAMRTSARLADGQALIIGGLNERSRTDDSEQTPFLHKIPIIGALFKSFSYADQDRELVFVITPVVIRDPIPDAGLWAHGSVSEMMAPLIAGEKEDSK